MGDKDAGRYGVIADGWKRCSANRVGATDNEQFYSTDVLAKAISLTFVKIRAHVNCYIVTCLIILLNVSNYSVNNTVTLLITEYFDVKHRVYSSLYVSSDLVDEKLDAKKINVKSTDRQIEMYLPNAFRVDIDSL
ncbi:hypothetical protein KIN20_023209 [Parelaphostrongylus tenuis]|uniref:Uncharacterized protein n=1 Tax=Parelaphostrongylus tenuis TaxID=148309 RepID=A0AAD5MRA9_PARTN|nr:hypothetical protein KIN20_023209 [Parelaphostrongylus tenuis]